MGTTVMVQHCPCPLALASGDMLRHPVDQDQHMKELVIVTLLPGRLSLIMLHTCSISSKLVIGMKLEI